MKRDDCDPLILALAGELGPEERAALEARLASDPGLRAELDRLRGVQALLRESRAGAFEPGFSHRVLRRLAPAPARAASVLAAALQRQFIRLAPVAVAALLLLGAHNLLNRADARQSTVEAALGLPPVMLEVAYEDALYDLEP